MRNCLRSLPIIRTQIEETSRQIERAVVGVCGSFNDIAARARQAVADSSELLDGHSETASVESSIETSRRTIGSLLDRMQRAAQLSGMAVLNMEEVSRSVSGIEALLSEVQRIAFTNKLVALNAKIEAVHVGALGSGFEVVADEISRQAERSTGLADGIATHIQEMRARVDAAATELRNFLAEDRQKLHQSKQDAEGALNMLLSLHQRTVASLEHAAIENAGLASEIADAVVALQFQDRVKQRMEHVLEALAAMENTCAGRGSSGGSTDLLTNMKSSYTMEAERLAHDSAAARPNPAPSEMEVELF